MSRSSSGVKVGYVVQ